MKTKNIFRSNQKPKGQCKPFSLLGSAKNKSGYPEYWRTITTVFITFFIFGNTSWAQSTVDFSQFANDPQVSWINGILQQNNSTYYEGSSTLQRIVFLGITSTPGNNHVVKIKHLAVKGGHHAYDFVTSYDRAAIDHGIMNGGPSFTGLTANGGAIGPPSNLGTTALGLFNGVAANKRIATQVTSAAYTNGGLLLGHDIGSRVAAYDGIVGADKRGVQLYGNAAITAASLVFTGYSAADDAGSQVGDSYAEYEIRWTSSSSQMLILFAGHLSLGSNFPSFLGVSYGQGKGAGAINGGPYHFKLLTLDGASLGNRDNQIKAGDIVIPPPPCTIAPLTRTICETAADPTFSGPAGLSNYTWTISPNTALSGATTQTVTVLNPAPGTYTLTLVTGNFGVTSIGSCTASLIVNPTVTAGTGSPARYCTSNAALASVDLFARLAGEQAGGVWTDAANAVVASPINLSAFAPGAYTFKYTVTPAQGSQCPPDDESIVITIDPTVTAGTGSPARYCIDNAALASIDLFARLAGEQAGGVWTDAANAVVASPINLSGSAAGAYVFTYTVTPPQGSLCPPDTESVTITIDPLPTISCPVAASLPVQCGVTAAAAQTQANADFATWFAQGPVSSAGFTVVPSYAYSSGATPAIVGNSPVIPVIGSPVVANPTSVTVTWTVTNTATGCVNSCNSTFTLQYGCPIGCTTAPTNLTCNGNNSGTIAVTVAGGTPPYTVRLFLSTDLVNPVVNATNPGTGIAEGGTYTFTGLAANVAPATYVVISTDAATTLATGGGCTAALTQPAALSLSPLGYTDVTCAGANTGTITATFSGGTPPYQLKLDGGAPIVATSPYTFLNVAAGSHTVNVYDSNYSFANGVSQAGCTDQESVTLNPPVCGFGCTPGFWQGGAGLQTWNQTTDPIAILAGFTSASSFFTVFNLAAGTCSLPSSLSMVSAINLGGGNCNKLARHGTAGLLNAITLSGYPLPAGIANVAAFKVAIKNAIVACNCESLASQIAANNELSHQYCGTITTGLTRIVAAAETNANIGFDVYPVPFKDQLTVRYNFDYKTDVKVVIFDIMGRILMSYDDKDAYFGKEVILRPEFTLSDENMYFVKVFTNRGYETKKIVSQK
jgi:hypothetical protein